MKELVLIVLISVIADMLLPTKSTQKYVRAVLGIAIIAAMIQPLVPMFHRDWPAQIANLASSEISGAGTNAGTRGESALEQGYALTLDSQEATAAGTLVADAIMAQLPVRLRKHVQSITVQNATTPDAIRARVVIDTVNMGTIQSVQQAVASLLHITVSGVTVESQGGQ